jgi:hypothetical protein
MIHPVSAPIAILMLLRKCPNILSTSEERPFRIHSSETYVCHEGRTCTFQGSRIMYSVLLIKYVEAGCGGLVGTKKVYTVTD